MKCSFAVGEDLVTCEWSMFGLEVYSVNGEEVMRTRSADIRAVRSFKVGPHDVEVRVDVMPTWSSWLFPTDWIAQAYVDGELEVEDLTKEFRGKAKSVDRVLNYLLVGTVTACLLLWIVVWALKSN